MSQFSGYRWLGWLIASCQCLITGNQDSGDSGQLLAAVTNYPGLLLCSGQLPGSGGSETKMMAVMCNVSVTLALHCYITGHVSAVTRPSQWHPLHRARAICPASAASGQQRRVVKHNVTFSRGKPCPGKYTHAGDSPH